MGNCFSSSKAQAVAQAAQSAVADILNPSQSASHTQTDPPGLRVISNAYVFRMPDGDTFTCDYSDNGTSQSARVRIMGIDCPESKQNFGEDARRIGEQIIFDKRVTLHVHTTDRYGRLVCDVIAPDGTNYGQEMLRQGAAWHYKAYDKRPHLAQLEYEAKSKQIGLWSYPRPQEPWEYRRRRREEA